jgi:hypothetical protein
MRCALRVYDGRLFQMSMRLILARFNLFAAGNFLFAIDSAAKTIHLTISPQAIVCRGSTAQQERR